MPPLTEIDVQETALAGAARSGDAAAFESLVERMTPRLFGFLLQKCGNRHDAEDQVQAVWVAVHRNLAQYDPVRPFRPWLFTIAHRTSVSSWRARRDHEQLAETDWVDQRHPAEDAMQREDAQSIWDRIRATLPATHREVLWLVYKEGMTVAEAAKALGCTVIRIKVTLHRARRRLHATLATGSALENTHEQSNIAEVV